MRPTVLLLVTVLQQPIEVEVELGRDMVEVGDTVSLTLDVTAAGNEPLSIGEPALVGLEVFSRSDRTVVEIQSGRGVRRTRRTLVFRALAAGSASIGSITIQQGDERVSTEPMELEVVPSTSRSIRTLPPSVRAMLDRAPPPTRSDEVTLAVLTSTDTVRVGEQLDVVVAAWIPREVRSRLRSTPTLDPPAVQGGWTYRQSTPIELIDSYRFSGDTYDLFAHYQAVFPLTAGGLEVGPARLTYNLPISFSFLSRELKRVVQSESLTVAVSELPDEASGGFNGAVGSGLNLSLRADPVELRVGEASSVSVSITGTGNVALWPAPDFSWPQGLRVYPGETSVDILTSGDQIGGTKTLKYVLVADSVGTHVIPETVYAYFDVVEDRYLPLSTPAVEIVAHQGPGPLAKREGAPPLMRSESRSPESVLRGLPSWIVLLVWLLPPVAVLVAKLSPTLRWRRSPRSREESMSLQKADRALRTALERLAPGAHHRERDDLVQALQAAGLDLSLAYHASKVRDRLRQSVYGPDGISDPTELLEEVEAVLQALPSLEPVA